MISVAKMWRCLPVCTLALSLLAMGGCREMAGRKKNKSPNAPDEDKEKVSADEKESEGKAPAGENKAKDAPAPSAKK